MFSEILNVLVCMRMYSGIFSFKKSCRIYTHFITIENISRMRGDQSGYDNEYNLASRT